MRTSVFTAGLRRRGAFAFGVRTLGAVRGGGGADRGYVVGVWTLEAVGGERAKREILLVRRGGALGGSN